MKKLTFIIVIYYLTLTDIVYSKQKDIHKSLTKHTFEKREINNKKIQKIYHMGEVPIDMTTASNKRDTNFGCRKTKYHRYIGNTLKNCSSTKPVRFASCEGICLPQFGLNRFNSNYKSLLFRDLYEYKCEAARVLSKNINVKCANDDIIYVYRVRIIKQCRCTKYLKAPFFPKRRKTKTEEAPV